MPKLEFWYDFASTYSYLSAMRVETLAAAAGVTVDWRPFLLGPVFKAQGWATSPFVIYPAKGRYMVRDIARLAADRNLPFEMPAEFPARSLAACRLALLEGGENWTRNVSQALFVAAFAHGRDISDPTVLKRAITDAAPEADSDDMLARSIAPENKAALHLQSNRAVERGVFGAPSFVCDDGELFWGDDRLEYALRWAQVL